MTGDLCTVVHQSHDAAPVPSGTCTGPRGAVLVHRWHSGTLGRTDTPARAELARRLRLVRDVLVELCQITDSVAWGAP